MNGRAVWYRVILKHILRGELFFMQTEDKIRNIEGMDEEKVKPFPKESKNSEYEYFIHV